MTTPLLQVRDLAVEVATPAGPVRVVDGISYDVVPGETLGMVGESGSGKTLAALALLGLLPPAAHVVAGTATLDGRDLLTLPPDELRGVRGRDVGMVFQDPMTALNPVRRVGDQVAEAITAHARPGRRAVAARVQELLAQVGIADPARTARRYPHQCSGGMRQRVLIAMAIAHGPRLLVADEPTTALDVTTQAQVLEVLREASATTGAATLLITHDLGVIAELAERVAVMYAGRIVELGAVDAIFHAPRHPYTLGLLASLPRAEQDLARLAPIPGQPPRPDALPSGCAFHPRCTLGAGRERCRTEVPPPSTLIGGHRTACHEHARMPAEVGRIAEATGASFEAAP